ncbi:hypothetical protein PGQ11_009151 [Apiospora arundinis]|uniref:Uncharacterized protein n=1 Tax=Apiospora arundinis TaxID=335852 RepID=A0ABR2IH63_9PEZI
MRCPLASSARRFLPSSRDASLRSSRIRASCSAVLGAPPCRPTPALSSSMARRSRSASSALAWASRAAVRAADDFLAIVAVDLPVAVAGLVVAVVAVVRACCCAARRWEKEAEEEERAFRDRAAWSSSIELNMVV